MYPDIPKISKTGGEQLGVRRINYDYWFDKNYYDKYLCDTVEQSLKSIDKAMMSQDEEGFSRTFN